MNTKLFNSIPEVVVESFENKYATKLPGCSLRNVNEKLNKLHRKLQFIHVLTSIFTFIFGLLTMCSIVLVSAQDFLGYRMTNNLEMSLIPLLFICTVIVALSGVSYSDHINKKISINAEILEKFIQTMLLFDPDFLSSSGEGIQEEVVNKGLIYDARNILKIEVEYEKRRVDPVSVEDLHHLTGMLIKKRIDLKMKLAMANELGISRLSVRDVFDQAKKV